jgi:hypothetical protein
MSSDNYALKITEEDDENERIAIGDEIETNPARFFRNNIDPNLRKINFKKEFSKQIDISSARLVWTPNPPDEMWFPEHIHIQKDGNVLSIDYILIVGRIHGGVGYASSGVRRHFVVRTNASSERMVKQLLDKFISSSFYEKKINTSFLFREICKHKELIYNPTPITTKRTVDFIVKHGFDEYDEITEALDFLENQRHTYEECMRKQRTGSDIDKITCEYSFMPEIE